MTPEKQLIVENAISKLEPVIDAVEDSIKDYSRISALGGIPSGELYVRLQGMLGINLDQYNVIITLVKARGHVKDSNHLLRYFE